VHPTYHPCRNLWGVARVRPFLHLTPYSSPDHIIICARQLLIEPLPQYQRRSHHFTTFTELSTANPMSSFPSLSSDDVEGLVTDGGLKRCAYITLLTRDSYVPGVVALIKSLRLVASQYPLVVMYTADTLSVQAVTKLRCEGCVMRQTERFIPGMLACNLIAYILHFHNHLTDNRQCSHLIPV
jgi:hypothetical protein